MNADLRRFYGVGLADVGGEVTWPELASLIEWLPPDAATRRSVHGERARWGDAEHLLASIVDLLAGANWQRADPKKSGPPPKPLPRPGETPKGTRHPKPTMSQADLRRWLDARKPPKPEEVTDGS